MGLSINQNIAAINSYRNLTNTQNDLSKSLEKLSSGFRINRAADDAAGLAISEGLRSQVGGLKVAVRNAQDGISVVQTAEGALTETHAILQRMRDLSVQAANTGGLSEDAKGNIQSEITQLQSELTRIADTTQFNGTNLLNGTYNGTFQVGANVGETISVNIEGDGLSAAGLGVDAINVSAAAQTGYVAGLAVGDQIADGSASYTVADGTVANINSALGLTGTYANAGELEDAITAAFGDAVSVEVAAGATTGNFNVTVTAAVAGTAGNFLEGTPTGYTAGTDRAATEADVTANLALAGGADLAITAIDEAIKTVSSVRADLGAVQNRFDHTIKNLNVAVENLSASESRIRDTDMAQEMVSFTRAQILSQAGTAMLAQANQIPQGVLSLLR